MKTAINLIISALLTTSIALCRAQTNTVPATVPYSIISQDGNSRTWEKIEYEVSPSGNVIPHKHHVVEVATGLNYWDGKKWRPSVPCFQFSADGQSVFANSVQHKVKLSANLNANSSVNITTPDGIALHTTPVAIGLYDEENSNYVIIAAITNCSGTLVSSNQIVYQDAFDNVAADIVYTLKRESFSQNVVLKQYIDPADYGCSSNSLIQIFTEFYNSPEPIVGKRKLRFGQLVFGQGRAFMEASADKRGGTPVTKEFKTINGRKFLIESVKFKALQKELRKLPRAAKAKISEPLKRQYAKIPSPDATKKATVLGKPHPPQIAQINRQSGLVLDYEVLEDPLPNVMLFQGDTTYFISGYIDCDFITLEGGTVLKFPYNTTPSGIDESDDVTCNNTGKYSPAVFTAVDDDSIGESMNGVPGSGYTGTIQSGGYAVFALGLSTGGPEQLENCRFCYCQEAIDLYNSSSDPETGVSLYDCQIVNCGSGVNTEMDDDGYILLANCLFANVNTATGDGGSTGDSLYCYDCTFDNCGTIYNNEGSTGDAALSVNSIFSNCGLGDGPNYGGYNGFYNCGGTFGSPAYTANSSPYQGVGGGNYYLANIPNHPFRGVGTTNIDQVTQNAGFSNFGIASTIVADLATKTTMAPPDVYDVQDISSLGASGPLCPTVPRDTNGVLYGYLDIGYHYAPLDYVFGGCDLSSSLACTNGTAVGWFEDANAVVNGGIPPFAISLEDGSSLSFNGNATQPDYFVKYNTVQEGEGNNWANNGSAGAILFNGTTAFYGGDPNNPPLLSAKFTKFAHDEGGGNLFCDANADGAVNFSDCEFYTARFSTYCMQYAYFTNCLFFRYAALYFQPDLGDAPYAINLNYDNCTFYNGGVEMNRYSDEINYGSSFWQFENCAFDGTAIEWQDDGYGDPNRTLINFNAYNTNNLSWQGYPYIVPEYPSYGPTYGTNEDVGPNDVLVGDFNWQTGPFGTYYLPSDSPLVESGSTNANYLGLYEFTTQTDQAKNANKIVDIGYHYATTDGAYLLDVNGDGMPDSWEMEYFNGLNVDPNGDPGGDGLNNLTKAQLGLNPNSSYSAIPASVNVETCPQ
jgi:hypothetical protein